ncbi:hypothetical protein PGT21_035270 [Puccinia graminis f. sp. tritici]|uniref:Uncharacterized protein n=1 Tax=Puccinia graminis f. sp. tritici TaxID=56615 RepID=A0A5B0N8C8_PUCGR|nr:hypothetical protein PGT21_035270 [Puccinia graminis f. sp. tritici]
MLDQLLFVGLYTRAGLRSAPQRRIWLIRKPSTKYPVCDEHQSAGFSLVHTKYDQIPALKQLSVKQLTAPAPAKLAALGPYVQVFRLHT